jgi:MFS transporter, Spinster family, sphingosine-1-phosphate transporter
VKPNAYRRYLLLLLGILLMCNFMDRFALGLVLQDIKRDLSLSDTQLGFLTGIAFALFYSLMGIPIARWTDTGNRVKVISVTAAVWSIAVALSGMAMSFGQLLVVRSVVAVGEAGGFVPGSSLLADYFDRGERPRALAIYGLGGPLSIVVGYLLGGWLSHQYGWRLMFLFLGAPGLLLALLARFTMREPRCGVTSEPKAIGGRRLLKPGRSIGNVCALLWSNGTYRQLLLCFSALFFFTYGILQWQPAFLMRSYGLNTEQIGLRFAVVYGIGGLLGTYLGGELASRYGARNERLQMRLIALAMICCGALSTVIYLSSSLVLSLGVMGAVMFAMTATTGPLYATIQTLVPEDMRGIAMALVLFFANLIGMGLGPLATGALSDSMAPWAGQESLRYALLLLSPGFLWPALHAWHASKTVERDLVVVTGAI